MMVFVMDEFPVAIVIAMDEAAISGLCRDGQLEIGVQAARKLRPNSRALSGQVESFSRHPGGREAAT